MLQMEKQRLLTLHSHANCARAGGVIITPFLHGHAINNPSCLHSCDLFLKELQCPGPLYIWKAPHPYADPISRQDITSAVFENTHHKCISGYMSQ